MAHFAQLNNENIVTQVIVVHNDELLDESGQEQEYKGIQFCHQLLGGTWVQTSYNATFRKNYAGIGYTYDSVRNAFLSPKPYPSWVLNEDTCRWEPPVAYPTDDKLYTWDENTTSWKPVDNS
jgi:hypothetical protein